MSSTKDPGRLASPSNDGLGPLYQQRDIMAQGQHYMRHLEAMTCEGLHAKSDIAAELAARDIEIERLRAELACAAQDCFAGEQDAHHLSHAVSQSARQIERLRDFANEVRRSGDARLASMAIAVLSATRA